MKKDFEPIKGGCLGCPLQGKTVVLPSGRVKDCKLVVVGQAPGGEEIEQGKPFVGKSGKKLWDELRALGIERDQCYVTNIAKCRPERTPDGKGDKPPDTQTKKHCAKQFEKEWKRIHDKTVLVLGNIASKQRTGKMVSAIAGKVVDDLGDGNAYVAAFHPSFIVRNLRMGQGENFELLWRRQLSLLLSVFNKPKKRPDVPFTIVTDLRGLRQCATHFTKSKSLAVDLETTAKIPSAPGARILTVALSDGIQTSVVDMDEVGESKESLSLLKSILASPVPKIAQNAKFEYVWLRSKYGIHLRNIAFDPAMARYLLDKGVGTSVALKQMVWRYFPEFGGYESGIDYTNMAAVPKATLYLYNALDAYLTWKLVEVLKPQLKKEGFYYVFKEILLPAIYPIGEMESVGLKLNTQKIEKQVDELKTVLEETEKELRARKAVKQVEDFKINSTHKMRELFFNVLGKRIRFQTRTGQPSLTQVELNGWANAGNKEAALILAYRKSYKLLRTYFLNYLQMATPEGFLHPNYNMVVARGGRLTSNSPNIQNVPNEVREVFISRFKKGRLLQMDFKQIEMRVMAIVANDPGLIRIFKQGGDPHRMTASEIMGIPPEQVSDEDRRGMKATNFGLLYGMLPKTLAEREKMPLQKAEMFYNGFFRRYHGVKEWQERQKAKVLRGEEIRSVLGRVRDLSIYPPEEKVNRAYNFPIQSTASDINLYFISGVWFLMRESRLKSVLVATVHDSLLIDCHPEEIEIVKDILQVVCESLSEVFKWMTVPMEIEIATGKNWKEAK